MSSKMKYYRFEERDGTLSGLVCGDCFDKSGGLFFNLTAVKEVQPWEECNVCDKPVKLEVQQ